MTAEGGAEETRDRAGGVLAHAREAVSGVVHGAEEKAKWAVQHTKGECVGSITSCYVGRLLVALWSRKVADR